MKDGPQLALTFRDHGGFRENSGRKRRLKSDPFHSKRERINSKTPAHITLKLNERIPNLRSPKFIRDFTNAVRRAQRFGLHIQHFTIESNHIHLIAEAEDNSALTSGLISLKTSIAWALKRVFMFYGSVFVGRYHMRLVRTPTEMRRLFKYVLFNHAHHCKSDVFADVYSTVFEFREIEELISQRLKGIRPRWQSDIKNCLSEARSWMQRVGWRRGR